MVVKTLKLFLIAYDNLTRRNSANIKICESGNLKSEISVCSRNTSAKWR